MRFCLTEVLYGPKEWMGC